MQVFGSNNAWRRNSWSGQYATGLARSSLLFLGKSLFEGLVKPMSAITLSRSMAKKVKYKTQLVLFKSTGYPALQELMPWK